MSTNPDTYARFIYYTGKLYACLEEFEGELDGEHTVGYQSGEVKKSLHIHIDGTEFQLFASDEAGMLTFKRGQEE